MGMMDRLFGWKDEPAYQPVAVQPPVQVMAYSVVDLANDLGLPEFMRGGENIAGASITRRSVMRNTAVKRSVNLISNVMGMLPLHLLQKADGLEDKKARDHHLYSLLADAPNTKQDAFQFRRLLQRWALIDHGGFAEVLRSRDRITGLLPIHPTKVRKRENWNDPWVVSNGSGGVRTIQPENMFHLMGDSDDGLNGIPLIDEAADALGLSLQADKAAARLFAQGALIRDVLQKENGRLSPEALANLKASLQAEFTGADSAHKTLVLEEGLKYTSVSTNAKDSQHLETRDHQVEEIARIFGMPRPFLMMDDTSWGSGIEQLGIYFTTYTLAPWLKAWESAIARILLTPEERRQGFYPKYNERALLRGSMADQAEFFSKMMGSGGSPQIMEQNEARALLDLPDHPDGSGLSGGVVSGGIQDGQTR